MTSPDDREEPIEPDEAGDYLGALLDAEARGEDAARAVVDGGVPDRDALERFARVLEELRVGVQAGQIGAAWVRPTEADVEAARELARRAHEGETSEDLRVLALRVYRVTADPQALYGLCAALGALAQDIPRRDRWLDPDALLAEALALCERGGEVQGFAPAPEDAADVRRLRQIAFDPAATEERKALVAKLQARMPKDQIAEAAARTWMSGSPATPAPGPAC